MPAICPKCGAEVRVNPGSSISYCPSCRRNVTVGEIKFGNPPVDEPDRHYIPAKTRRKFTLSPTARAFLLVIAVVAIMSWAARLTGHKKSQPAAAGALPQNSANTLCLDDSYAWIATQIDAMRELAGTWQHEQKFNSNGNAGLTAQARILAAIRFSEQSLLRYALKKFAQKLPQQAVSALQINSSNKNEVSSLSLLERRGMGVVNEARISQQFHESAPDGLDLAACVEIGERAWNMASIALSIAVAADTNNAVASALAEMRSLLKQPPAEPLERFGAASKLIAEELCLAAQLCEASPEELRYLRSKLQSDTGDDSIQTCALSVAMVSTAVQIIGMARPAHKLLGVVFVNIRRQREIMRAHAIDGPERLAVETEIMALNLAALAW